MGSDRTYDSSFHKAKSRWEKVILSDLPDVPAQLGLINHDWFDGIFGQGKAVNDPIDDVLIGYSVTHIDGIPLNGKNILGQAMPLYVRLTSTLSAPTISGIMIFDKDDFDSLNRIDVELIIAHEMVRAMWLKVNDVLFSQVIFVISSWFKCRVIFLELAGKHWIGSVVRFASTLHSELINVHELSMSTSDIMKASLRCYHQSIKLYNWVYPTAVIGMNRTLIQDRLPN